MVTTSEGMFLLTQNLGQDRHFYFSSRLWSKCFLAHSFMKCVPVRVPDLYSILRTTPDFCKARILFLSPQSHWNHVSWFWNWQILSELGFSTSLFQAPKDFSYFFSFSPLHLRIHWLYFIQLFQVCCSGRSFKLPPYYR